MHHHENSFNLLTYIGFIPFIVSIFLYVYAVETSNKKFRDWPFYRIILFIIGNLSIVLAIIGPLAKQSHTHFVYHMYTHLILGMLGPLLIVLSAPMTLLLRSIPIKTARKVSRLLKSKYVQIMSHPILAGILNLGGLWILYTTSLFEMMHHSIMISILVHGHIFLAGYFFTISIVYIDPTPHRTSFLMRSIVLILYMAGHSILSKWIYANPPGGVSKLDAEYGGLTMYYGGDLVDVILIIVLCYQLFHSRTIQAKLSKFYSKLKKPSPRFPQL
ncbi:MAG TPA: cytochrome c oxidase assembly protein [Ureibacillus sp.]|nr:cytochrome c oxidase assembly protein [Ureibacillus sp.]